MPTKVQRARKYVAEFREFAGLSDRRVPLHMKRIEASDLRNVELSERTIKRRNGFVRVHNNMLRDCSVRFDGVDDYIRIPHQTAYNPGSTAQLVTFDVALRTWPTSEVTLLSKGTGTGSSRFFRLSYDPTLNTNNGGWKIIAYDATAGALRTFTVNDGSGLAGASPVHFYRHICLTCTTYGTRTYTMSVFDSAGNLIGASSTEVVNWITSTDPWIIGADTSASGFANFTGAELRLRIHDGSYDAVTASLIVDRELTPTEAATMTGYWKMNDGQGSRIADSTATANYGTAEVEGPAWLGAWNGNQSLILGRSGLAFYGGAGHVHWKLSSGLAQGIFHASTFGRRWSISFSWTPIVEPGETAVRSQTLLWAGTDATDPSPIGVVVDSSGGSQRLVAKYRDGTSTKSAVLTGLSLASNSSVIGKRVRVVVAHSIGVASSERLEFYARAENGMASAPYAAQTTTDGANPLVVSDDIAIGLKVTSFSYPQTFSGPSAFSILDDFAIHKPFFVGTPPPVPPWGQQLSEWSMLDTISPGSNLVCGIPMNDGYGHVLQTRGSYATGADLYPEEDQGLLWDEGLVEPYEAQEARLAMDFSRIDSGGKVVKRKLVVSGTTLYEIDEENSIARAVRGNIHKPGKISYAQYGDSVYLAAPNGKRPRVYNGSNLDWVGIRAPFQTPVPVAAAGGSLASGTYHLYVTYRNSVTGAESNPSPAASVTCVLNDKITSVQVPISADSQVDQRRVWMTVANGGAGSTAYLVATITDNETYNYTTDITTVLTTSATMDYTGNEEAPLGSLVGVFKDRLFVSGNPLYPTRIYYSDAGTPWAFHHSEQFEDTDLDSGDPVTMLRGLRDYIVAHAGDGRVALTPTGSTSVPFYLNYLSRDSGAVGPLACVEFESTHVYATERDFYIWDGSNSLNISSPPDEESPSIQTLVRSGLNPSRRRDISVTMHRARNQFWFSCASAGIDYNDTVLVYNWDQRKWSRYDLDVDMVVAMEDLNDDPWIYGVHQGFLVKLDYGTFDGTSNSEADVVGIAASGTTTTVTPLAAAWTTNEYKGLWVYYYHAAENIVDVRRLASNTPTTFTLYTALSNAPTAGDVFIIASMNYYYDFNINLADPLDVSRLQFATFRVTSSDTGYVRLNVQSNKLGRAYDASEGTNYVREVTTSTNVLRINLGGAAGNFRCRLGDTSANAEDSAPWLPGLGAVIEYQAFEIETETMPARLS